MQQVKVQGADKVAIRSVAAELGLAPNAIYHYFASLAILQEALADESRRMLLERMKRVVGRKGPDEAIRAISEAYVQFAREQPEFFSLTLKPSNAQEGELAAHLQSWHFVLGEVGRVYGEKRAAEAALALWAFLHGFAVLQQAGVFGKLKPASSFAFGLQTWLDAA